MVDGQSFSILLGAKEEKSFVWSAESVIRRRTQTNMNCWENCKQNTFIQENLSDFLFRIILTIFFGFYIVGQIDRSLTIYSKIDASVADIVLLPVYLLHLRLID